MVTEDGYHITMFHLIADKPATLNPVVFVHGLGGTAMSFMSTMKGLPLPCELSNLGHDVYMPNNRGAMYSQGHDTLDIHSKEYWQFDWSYFGKYETVTVVETIRERRPDLGKAVLIGHS